MVYYGKSYYFVQQVMPCLPDSTLFGYSSAQTALVEENRQLVWSHFVDNELLFENDHTLKTRYLGDRPSTVEINSKMPGQVGPVAGVANCTSLRRKTRRSPARGDASGGGANHL